MKVKDFTNDEIKWLKPYNKTNTVIFISNKGEFDTIIFFKKVVARDTVRNFEQGFYNKTYLTVPYKLTQGSYHQFALMGDGKARYDQDVINFSKSSSDDYISMEITFLGTYFDGKELSNIQQINGDVYYFDGARATYNGMDVEKGINNFTFDTRIGIIKYTDVRNVEWIRK